MDNTHQLRYVYLASSEMFTLSIDSTRQLFLSSESHPKGIITAVPPLQLMVLSRPSHPSIKGVKLFSWKSSEKSGNQKSKKLYEVPVEEHDRPLDCVVTSDTVICEDNTLFKV